MVPPLEVTRARRISGGSCEERASSAAPTKVPTASLWACSWLILGAAGLLPDSVAAVVGVLAFMGVFAFGETLLQPTVPAIYNDLASDHNRGRYNAINAAAFQAGAITGPIAAGLLLGEGLDAVYIGVMVVGCLGIGVLATALERRIPAAANGVTVAEIDRETNRFEPPEPREDAILVPPPEAVRSPVAGSAWRSVAHCRIRA